MIDGFPCPQTVASAISTLLDSPSARNPASLFHFLLFYSFLFPSSPFYLYFHLSSLSPLFLTHSSDMAPMAREPGQKGVNWSNIAVGMYNSCAQTCHLISLYSIIRRSFLIRCNHEHGISLSLTSCDVTDWKGRSLFWILCNLHLVCE